MKTYQPKERMMKKEHLTLHEAVEFMIDDAEKGVDIYTKPAIKYLLPRIESALHYFETFFPKDTETIELLKSDQKKLKDKLSQKKES